MTAFLLWFDHDITFHIGHRISLEQNDSEWNLPCNPWKCSLIAQMILKWLHKWDDFPAARTVMAVEDDFGMAWLRFGFSGRRRVVRLRVGLQYFCEKTDVTDRQSQCIHLLRERRSSITTISGHFDASPKEDVSVRPSVLSNTRTRRLLLKWCILHLHTEVLFPTSAIVPKKTLDTNHNWPSTNVFRMEASEFLCVVPRMRR